MFLLSIPETIQLEMVSSMDKDSETLIEIGKNYQEQVDQINKKINAETPVPSDFQYDPGYADQRSI